MAGHVRGTIVARDITLLLGAVASWLTVIVISSTTLAAALVLRPGIFLYDWSVYLSGAKDLLEHELYVHPLRGVGLSMSAAEFKLPPAAAIPALPLTPLDPVMGGVIWSVANVLAFAASAYVLCRLAGVRHPWLWSGLGLAVYSLNPVYEAIVLLGNINPLELAILAAFAWAYLRRRDRLAGLLLGLAVAVKLWPLPLMLLLWRERRWQSIRWTSGALLVQAAAFIVWLGPAVIPNALATAQSSLPPSDPSWVFYVSWLARNVAWWPAWGGAVVAGALALVPLRGRAGIGVGMLAGLALVSNLWRHYEPTFAFACILVAADLQAAYRQRRQSRLRLSAQSRAENP